MQHQVSDLEKIIEDGSVSAEMTTAASSLELLRMTDIKAFIPDTDVHVGPVSVEIKKGEMVALYGETGKGKSTLLNSLFYPEYRESGVISWNDEVELLNLPVPKAIYVTQKAYLLTGTLRENFEGYADEEIEEVLKTVDLATWRNSLPDGLGSWLGENGETLSGGQRKKLLLAQALLKRPQLLVVDEPTAGISTENAIEIFKNIQLRHPGITILMATHLKEFEKVADKVVSIF